jgi:aminoglycoside phosphotransferase (APT) family kinase protein
LSIEQPQSVDQREPLLGGGADRLLAYLRDASGQPELLYADPPARITGGNETFIYGFSLSGAQRDEYRRPLILRAYRQGYVRPDQARFEATVQNAIAGLGYPAPRVFTMTPDASVLGTPFIVMERLQGTSVLEGVGQPDESGHMRFRERGRLLRSAGLLNTIPRVCADAQLRLHALDARVLVDAVERAGLSTTSLTVKGRLEGLCSFIEDSHLDGLGAAAAWLVDHTPEPARLAICHCDIQPINILMAGATITGVVDWSQVIVADPALDVGYTKMALGTVPLAMPRFLQWMAWPVSRITSWRYIQLYRKRQPVRPQTVAYYGALRAVRPGRDRRKTARRAF